MSSFLEELSLCLQEILQTSDVALPENFNYWQPCADARFGDYQSNAAMTLSKQAGKNPRELATQIAEAWNAKHERMGQLSVAGGGFINLRLNNDFIVQTFQSYSSAPRVKNKQTLVIDFSAPNVAKAMHVGHIRSTILGDCLARVMRFLGHRVITDNHIGDWGTQFGKLIIGFRKYGSYEKLEQNPIAEMERLYKLAHEASQKDEKILEEARFELKKLQEGDEENLALWEKFRALSHTAFDRIYERLDVRFDHILGESFYNPQLKMVVEDLVARGVAKESEGAICVFFDEPNLKDKPFLIQKSDGAALYATTDIATLFYRVKEFHPDAVWYVTDSRQTLHFQQLFATACRCKVSVGLVHVTFGTILGADKKPLKTREGDPVKLEALLDEAVARALEIVKERRPDLSEKERQNIAEILGIGSVKYADLVQNRHLDYVFDWKKLLAFDGNTAPYVLNAYVRTQSIIRKANEMEVQEGALQDALHPKERELVLLLLQWHAVLEEVALEQRPHHLCFYLYRLASLFHSFFEECPVLKAESAIRAHRLTLCRRVAETLKQGCELLGIRTLERM
ncbi:MAG: arginine--tRNA ligase [Verrucomicrobiae bacterium]|nr:arginine--tRNA ligase [Verrucomicrobiae bacterium]